MQTLADFLNWAEAYFLSGDLTFGHGTDNAWDEAVAIARYVLKLPIDAKREFLDIKLQNSEKDKLIVIAKKRKQTKIPVAYLTKEAWFCGKKYYVDRRVIIPRSPFAELINKKFKPFVKIAEIKRILDLCTGSGCMAIACAHAFPKAEIDAVDISKEALEVANYNVKKHQVINRVNVIKSDLFQKLKGKKYDLIISNPPYVGLKEYKELPKEYYYEPKLALFSISNGLACTQKILQQSYNFLQPKGLLFVEVGNSWQDLSRFYPKIKFNWLKFNQGGNGVFMLTKLQLRRFVNL